MKFDKKTGVFDFPEIGAGIGPSLSLTAFLETSAFAGARVCMEEGPWRCYQLRAISQPVSFVEVGVLFASERLVSVALRHITDQFRVSKKDRSVARELSRKAFHDDWLASVLGAPEGLYDWGEILSIYEGMEGSDSWIRFSYAMQHE